MTEQAKTRSKRARQRKGFKTARERGGDGSCLEDAVLLTKPGDEAVPTAFSNAPGARAASSSNRHLGHYTKNPSDWRATPMIALSLGLPPTIRRKNTRNVFAQ